MQWKSFLTLFSIFKLRALILLHNWISKWAKWVKVPRVMVVSFLPVNYALNIATYSRTPFNQGETKIHNQTLIQEHLKCHRKCCYIAIISHNHELPHSSCFSVCFYTTTAPPSPQHAPGLQLWALHKHKPQWLSLFPAYNSLITSSFSCKLYPPGTAPQARHFWPQRKVPSLFQILILTIHLILE